jgi:hypothetical protein
MVPHFKPFLISAQCAETSGEAGNPPVTIAIHTFTSQVSLSSPQGLYVTFTVGGPVKVSSLELDLLGDGYPEWVQNFPGEHDVREWNEVRVMPYNTGTFVLVMRARDVRNCFAQTGVKRIVTVVP